MPTATRSRRQATFDSPPATTTEPELLTESPASAPAVDAPPTRDEDEDFFEWMESIPQATWEEKIYLYLYRLWPEIVNPGDKAFLEPRFSRAVDRDEISKLHGGGKYRIMLNWRPWRKSFASHEFTIQGPPKFQPGQVMKSTGQPPVIEGASAAEANGNSALVAEIRNLLTAIAKPDVAQDKIIETLTTANQKAVELVAAAGKKQIEGNAAQQSPDAQLQMLTTLLTLVKQMTPAPVNPLASLGEMATLMKALQPAGEGGFLREFKEAFGEKLVEQMFSGEGAMGGPDWRSMLAQGAMKLIDTAPTMLDKILQLQRNAQRQPQVINAPPAPPIAPAPTLAAPPVVPPHQPVPVAIAPAPAPPVDVNTPAPLTEEQMQQAQAMMRASAMQLVVECFQRGEDGGDAVLVLSHVAEPVLAEIAPTMEGAPLFLVMQWVRKQPAFAAIKDDPRLEEFVKDFQADVERWAAAQQDGGEDAGENSEGQQ